MPSYIVLYFSTTIVARYLLYILITKCLLISERKKNLLEVKAY